MRALELNAVLHASTCPHEGGEKRPAGNAVNPPCPPGNHTGNHFFITEYKSNVAGPGNHPESIKLNHQHWPATQDAEQSSG